MPSLPPYKIFPLGDSALTIDFGNVIDPIINDDVISIFDYLSSNKIPGMIEAVPAYSSLTLYYDLAEIKKRIKIITAFEWIKQQVEAIIKSGIVRIKIERQVIRIPVCYEREFALDSEKIAAEKNLSVDEIINIHTSSRYRVYLLGFLPGFAYMGQVDERISIERKPEPENIKAGSVGIAGRQTGIYPFDSPGGWQIIGRTPLKIFNGQKSIPTLFHAGDVVEFYSITKDEFEDIKSRHS